MTGFGRGDASSGGIKVEAELASVNRKQYDLRISLPRSLSVLEPRIGELVHRVIARGQVTGNVKVALSGSARRQAVMIDVDLAADYARRLRKAASRLGVAWDMSMSQLVNLPEVIRHEETEEDTEKLWPLVRRAVEQALRHLVEMRRAEGQKLESDLRKQVARLRRLAARVDKQAPKVAARYRDVLIRRIASAGVPLGTDDPALLKEVALYADRSDITEELVRLASHFDQADSLFDDRKPVGRALDFLCQEIYREINTIGSKANDASIAGSVIDFKATLERIREQVQNVE
jgi:uncharacterized protein (TIGR00255 family)